MTTINDGSIYYEFYDEYKSWWESRTGCEVSYERGFIIFRKAGTIVLQFNIGNIERCGISLDERYSVGNGILFAVLMKMNELMFKIPGM